MFTINDDLSIYVTRGDVLFFTLSANEDDTEYTFQAGDVVRFRVFGKKDPGTVMLKKDFIVSENAAEVEIVLTGEETSFGDLISKPTDYWYEVELNPDTFPQTIIGYDEDGEKIFRLYPEGGEEVTV